MKLLTNPESDWPQTPMNKIRQCRILAISVSNGDVQVLKTFDRFYWLQLSVSPDNQFIAYHYPNVKNGKFSDPDIHLISTDGKYESKLFEHPANDQILGWFPDKNQLLFKSNRSGTWDAWKAEVINGNVAEEPVRVLTEIGKHAYAYMTELFGLVSPAVFNLNINEKVFDLRWL